MARSAAKPAARPAAASEEATGADAKAAVESLALLARLGAAHLAVAVLGSPPPDEATPRLEVAGAGQR
ncbi:MAG TPA: hypothetical protein PLZ95_15600 [Bryobacteraceae bacterium]|nr:hypothetical protein [Bryobacteraceae bacterium]